MERSRTNLQLGKKVDDKQHTSKESFRGMNKLDFHFDFSLPVVQLRNVFFHMYVYERYRVPLFSSRRAPPHLVSVASSVHPGPGLVLHVVLEVKPWSLHLANQVLNHWTISPALGKFSLPDVFTHRSCREVRRSHFGHMCPFIKSYCLCTGILISVPLNCFNWSLLTLLVTRSTNTIGCVSFLVLVYKKVISETKTSSYTQCLQVAKDTVFHWRHSILMPIFVGSNVQMILIYFEDELSFLSWILMYFEYHWKAQETELLGKWALSHLLKIQSDYNRRWLSRTKQRPGVISSLNDSWLV